MGRKGTWVHAYLRGWPGWWDRCPAAPGLHGSAPRPGCCRPPCSCAPRPRCCPRRAQGWRASASPPEGSWGHRFLRNTRERGSVSPPAIRNPPRSLGSRRVPRRAMPVLSHVWSLLPGCHPGNATHEIHASAGVFTASLSNSLQELIACYL